MLVLPVSAMAQTSSINAFSPYSMYGVGELQTPGIVAQRSMGGVGLGMRSTLMVNPLNPAAYSMTPRQGFLFDFGVEGVNFYNRQQKYGDGGQSVSRTSYNTFNFHDIAFQLPLAKRLGLGFSLTPYSSVGYRVSADDQSDDVWGNIGRVQYLYAGEGDLTEVKLGIGWEVAKRFSIGIAAQYYWGDIERTYQTVVTNNIIDGGSVNTVTGTDSYVVSRVKMQAGVQVDLIQSERQLLTLGATYDMGGNLRPSVNSSIITGDIYGTPCAGIRRAWRSNSPFRRAWASTIRMPKLRRGSTTSIRTGSATSRRGRSPERSMSPTETRAPSRRASSTRPTGWTFATTSSGGLTGWDSATERIIRRSGERPCRSMP